MLIIVFLVGCTDKIVKTENITSNGECILKCKKIMKENWCYSATPIYEENIRNEITEKINCECILYDCWK